MVPKQSEIDHCLYDIKLWYKNNWPLCGFCGHLVRDNGDLAHLIRRSYSRELQTNKLNLVLCHRHCHDIFDESPEKAQYLPRMTEVMYIIYLLDKEYFNQLAERMPELHPAFELFPDVRSDISDIKHHGELITLQYLHK